MNNNDVRIQTANQVVSAINAFKVSLTAEQIDLLKEAKAKYTELYDILSSDVHALLLEDDEVMDGYGQCLYDLIEPTVFWTALVSVRSTDRQAKL